MTAERKNVKFDSAPIIILYFGCTNTFFDDCIRNVSNLSSERYIELFMNLFGYFLIQTFLWNLIFYILCYNIIKVSPKKFKNI